MYFRFSHQDGGGENRFKSIKLMSLVILISWTLPFFILFQRTHYIGKKKRQRQNLRDKNTIMSADA